jgi:hypothetical protein
MTEKQLKNRIDEIITNDKNMEKKLKDKIIVIDFEQSNSNKIQFVSDYIINYYKDDEYNYIFLVHIKRRFINDKQKEIRIYSIPNVNEDINQIFIDNLNGPPKITLKNLFDAKNKKLMINNIIIEQKDDAFKNSLSDFVYKQINEKNKINMLKNPLEKEGEDI